MHHFNQTRIHIIQNHHHTNPFWDLVVLSFLRSKFHETTKLYWNLDKERPNQFNQALWTLVELFNGKTNEKDVALDGKNRARQHNFNQDDKFMSFFLF